MLFVCENESIEQMLFFCLNARATLLNSALGLVFKDMAFHLLEIGGNTF